MGEEGRGLDREAVLILVGFTLSGAAALIYEVTWTRALSLVLGSTVYALSTMLSTFMGGLALGAYLAGRYVDRSRNLLLAFGLCELGIGLSGLLSIPLIYKLPEFYLSIFRAFHTYPAVFFSFEILICTAIMLVPTTLMGATFPLVSRRITSSVDHLGSRVASAYTFNTVGAVLGSLAAGFLLIPVIGIRQTAMVAAALNAAVGLGMVIMSGARARTVAAAVLPLFAMGSYVALCPGDESCYIGFYTARKVPATGSYQSILADTKANLEELFRAEPPEGSVRAYRSLKGELILQVGGKLEGTTVVDIPNTLLQAYLPVASHERPESFLAIGLGAGVTLAAARATVPHAELVEINPGVIRAVRRYGIPGLLDGIPIAINDARNHLLRTERQYDIISSEPSYPTEAGVSNLFTYEFYELAASRLTPGGVFAQWLPAYLLDSRSIGMMARTVGSVFPHVRAWHVKASGDLIMVGRLTPFPFTPEETLARVRELNASGFPLDVALFMGEDEVNLLVHQSDLPINSDDLPLLEFAAVASMLAAQPHRLN